VSTTQLGSIVELQPRITEQQGKNKSIQEEQQQQQLVKEQQQQGTTTAAKQQPTGTT
jgi:hypothetical protein